ncbi:MAG: hypothetical protein ACFCBU_12235 [Cyanophyceae cyanobacterium]
MGLIWAVPITASSHSTKIVSDIAVTVHVEPEHQPTAGQPTRVWFLLTRQGGEVVPLSIANCTLEVRKQPFAPGNSPLLTPEVVPIEAERYQSIPGANLTFPEAGTYDLTFGCAPKTAGNFGAFSIDHEAIVKSGVGSAIAPIETPVTEAPATDTPVIEAASGALSNSANSPAAQWGYGVGMAAVFGVGAIGFLAMKRNNRLHRK